jgi:uncharacterized DUF497 family protein
VVGKRNAGGASTPARDHRARASIVVRRAPALFVVFAWAQTKVRVITARDMTKAERRFLLGR